MTTCCPLCEERGVGKARAAERKSPGWTTKSSLSVHIETFWPLLHLKAISPREAIITVCVCWGWGCQPPDVKVDTRPEEQQVFPHTVFTVSCLWGGFGQPGWVALPALSKILNPSVSPVTLLTHVITSFDWEQTATQIWVLVRSNSKVCSLHLTHKQCQSEGWVNAQDIQLEMTPCLGRQVSFAPGPDTGKSPQSIHSPGLSVSLIASDTTHGTWKGQGIQEAVVSQVNRKHRAQGRYTDLISLF